MEQVDATLLCRNANASTICSRSMRDGFWFDSTVRGPDEAARCGIDAAEADRFGVSGSEPFEPGLMPTDRETSTGDGTGE